jgi:hypothetical protein
MKRVRRALCVALLAAGCGSNSGTGGACVSASDCKGPLPLICQICDGGSTGCPHWVCQGGQCVERTCS